MSKKENMDSEEYTYEVDVPNTYGTLEKFVASKDYVMMLSQMPDKVRENFFNAYMGCEMFKIINHDCVGNRCFIVVEFWYKRYGEGL